MWSKQVERASLFPIGEMEKALSECHEEKVSFVDVPLPGLRAWHEVSEEARVWMGSRNVQVFPKAWVVRFGGSIYTLQARAQDDPYTLQPQTQDPITKPGITITVQFEKEMTRILQIVSPLQAHKPLQDVLGDLSGILPEERDDCLSMVATTTQKKMNSFIFSSFSSSFGFVPRTQRTPDPSTHSEEKPDQQITQSFYMRLLGRLMGLSQKKQKQTTPGTTELSINLDVNSNTEPNIESDIESNIKLNVDSIMDSIIESVVNTNFPDSKVCMHALMYVTHFM